MKTNILFLLFLTFLVSGTAQPLEWIHSSNDAGSVRVHDMTRNYGDHMYVTGPFQGDLDLGGSYLQPIGNHNAYITKFDGQGNHHWAMQMHSSSLVYPTNVGMRSNGEIVVSGLYMGATTFTGLSNDLRNMRSITLPDPQAPISIFMVSYTHYGGLLWAKGLENSQVDAFDIRGMKVDRGDNSRGNIYWYGGLKGIVDMDLSANGQHIVRSSLRPDVYTSVLAKYDGGGNIIYTKEAHAKNGSSISALAVNRGQNFHYNYQYNFVMGGNYDGYLDLGNNISFNRNGKYLYFAILDYQGQIQSTHHISVPGGGRLNELVMDDQANIYLSGQYYRGISIGGNSYLGSGKFLAKYDQYGNFMWATVGIPQDLSFGVGLNKDQEIILSGVYRTDTLQLDPEGENLQHRGDFDIFVAKFDAQGQYLDAFTIGGPRRDLGGGLVVKDNWFAIAGYHNGDLDFDPRGPGNLIPYSGSQEIYLAKYSYPSLTSHDDKGIGSFFSERVVVNETYKIHPNPVYDTFVMEHQEAKGDKIAAKLVNMQGDEIFREIYSLEDGKGFHQKITLNRSKVPEGMYFLLIQDQEGIHTEKIMLK